MRLIDPQRAIGIEIVEPRGMLGTMQGLLGQPELPAGYGVLLRTKEVHTIGMRYAIDTVYLSRRGDVLRVDTMAPGRLGPLVLRARWILEMRAGEAARLGISPGTTLVPAGPSGSPGPSEP